MGLWFSWMTKKRNIILVNKSKHIAIHFFWLIAILRVEKWSILVIYICYNYLRSYAYLDGLQIQGNFGSLKITDVCFSSSAYWCKLVLKIIDINPLKWEMYQIGRLFHWWFIHPFGLCVSSTCLAQALQKLSEFDDWLF